jgi:hypothetical protein
MCVDFFNNFSFMIVFTSAELSQTSYRSCDKECYCIQPSLRSSIGTQRSNSEIYDVNSAVLKNYHNEKLKYLNSLTLRFSGMR